MDSIRDTALPHLPGRLRAIETIGAGAFSTVWLAWDPDLDCPVAVKILAENWSAQGDVRERFLAEARLLRRVDSDNLVRVYDVGVLDDGRPFIVMTYAADGSLSALLRDGPLAPGCARALLRRVADGLAVLHEHGIVHRDLNPNNILLTKGNRDSIGGRVLLADLGLAKDLAAASGLTQPGGTGIFRAPEQLTYSDEVSAASDVYAFAVLVDHLVPLLRSASPTVAPLLDAARSIDPAARPPLDVLATAVDAALADAVAHGMSDTPPATANTADTADSGRTNSCPAATSQRQTQPELLSQTAASPTAASQTSATDVVTTVAAPASPPRRRRRWLLAAGAVLVLAAGAGTYLAWLRTPVRIDDPKHVASVGVPQDWRAVGTTTMPPASVPSSADPPAATSGLVVEDPDGRASVAVAWVREPRLPDDQVTAVSHPGCTSAPPRDVVVAGMAGQRVDWTCRDDEVRSEVAVSGPAAALWVQVRSRQAAVDTDELLGRVRLTGL